MLFLQKKHKDTLISIILPMIVNKSSLKVSGANAQNAHPQTSTQTHTYPSAVDQMSVLCLAKKYILTALKIISTNLKMKLFSQIIAELKVSRF